MRPEGPEGKVENSGAQLSTKWAACDLLLGAPRNCCATQPSKSNWF